MNRPGTSRWLLLLCLLGYLASASAAEKTEGAFTLDDALTLPNHPIRITGALTRRALLADQPLGGEPVELLVDGQPAASTMTGGDGRAYFEYVPRRSGVFPMSIRLGASPRVTATESSARLFVWERRRPILLVEGAALVEQGANKPPPFPSLPGDTKPGAPKDLATDASEELGRLSQFYYNLVYVAWPADGTDGAIGAETLRRLMAENRLPVGYVLSVKPGRQALEAALRDLKQQGWSQMKAGIGRSKAFAEALLEQRMEVVVVSESESRKREVPRKAKVAKGWKDVRKKL